MNKSIVSLCQEWQSYQLPEWRHAKTPAPFYSESIEHILQLIEELASVRAYLRLIDQRREQLAKQAVRWDVCHDPTDIEFCWNCYFLNHSFNPEDASQIIKTLKTCFYKETYEMKEAAAPSGQVRLLDNSILQRIMKLKNGLLDWKLALGFSADLGDILKGIKFVVETRITKPSSNEVFNHVLEDMEILFKPVFQRAAGADAEGGSLGEGAGLKEAFAPVEGAPAPSGEGAPAPSNETSLAPSATPSPSSITSDVVRRCEEIVLRPCALRFGEFVKMRHESDRQEISNLIKGHYQKIEVNLSDYLSQFKIYEPNKEILNVINNHRSVHKAWNERRKLWSKYLGQGAGARPTTRGATPGGGGPATTSLALWPVDDLIDQIIEENIARAKGVLLSQLRTLERIRRRSLDKDNVIRAICDSDREAWLHHS